MIYDFIIIGGGPCGIVSSWLLSKQYKILLIEKDNDIGGCHKVIRNNNLFTEHGPRVYSNNYVNFMNILGDMNLNFDDFFVPYEFSISTISGETVYDISFREFMILSFYFIRFIINDNYSRTLSLDEFMINNNFNETTKDLFDRICRLTDGVGSNKYSVYEFFQLLNQNLFYKLYQPNNPNDTHLFKFIKEKLLNNNVDIKLNTKITKLNYDEKTNKIISVNNIKCNNVIIATPLTNYLKIIKNSNLEKYINYDNIFKFNQYNKYDTYIPITFHWKNKLNLKKVWGFNKTKNGLAFIILSDYMKIDGTLISTCFTKVNDELHKLNENELINEAFNQLKETFDLIEPDNKILYSKIYKENDKWINEEDAFMRTNENKFIKSKTEIKNLYSLGSHNGNSYYSFTTMESATTNAIYFSNKFLKNNKRMKIKDIWTLKKSIKIIILIILLFLLYKLLYNVR